MTGKMIESLLEDLGRSQRWLSQKLGITSMTVSLWIKNNTKLKSKYTKMILKLISEEAYVLNDNANWLSSLIKNEGRVDGSRLD